MRGSASLRFCSWKMQIRDLVPAALRGPLAVNGRVMVLGVRGKGKIIAGEREAAIPYGRLRSGLVWPRRAPQPSGVSLSLLWTH